MGKYLHLFEDLPEFNAYFNSEYYEEPFVSLTEKDASGNTINKIDYNKPPHDYSQDNFTIEILSNGIVTFPGLYGWDENDEQIALYMEYKKNGGEWITIDSSSTISVVTGDELEFRSDLTYLMNGDDEYSLFRDITSNFNVKGNIMSLLSNDFDLSSAFRGCTNLISAEHLVLPATTLGEYCYAYMFQDCTSLTTAPELPATTLASNCYAYMFEGCTSLTTAPELPATTLGDYCYASMFINCRSLTTAPELPATTLADGCYGNMFQGCTSLTTAPELPATTLGEYCYASMFQNCTSLTTAPELPATTLADNCYNSMFAGCTSLVTAPELPVTTLEHYCYYGMFEGCTSLTTAPKILPATSLAQGCYYNMFYGCTSLTTAPELPATTLVVGCYEEMFHGCTSLNYIKAMFLTTPSGTYTYNWVFSVNRDGTFVKNNSATWDVKGINGIPIYWTVQDAS